LDMSLVNIQGMRLDSGAFTKVGQEGLRRSEHLLFLVTVHNI